MRMDCLPTGHVINDELTMSPSVKLFGGVMMLQGVGEQHPRLGY
jgi:hypothetical protein